MSTLLMVAGGLIAVLGAILIPLPGPGFPLLILGAIVLLAGAVIAATRRRGSRQTS